MDGINGRDTPENITPSYVSPLTYKDYDCDQLGAESVRVADALTSASEQQRTARSNDTIGVIFLGLPVSRAPLKILLFRASSI